MKVQYTRAALRDLDQILNYLGERSPQGAERVQARLESVIALVAHRPNIGVRTTSPRIRKISATPFPYLVFFAPAADRVTIVGVRHAARDPRSMPGS